MADYLSLIAAIPSLISNFSGSSAPYMKEQEQLAARQNQISQALLEGPKNDFYKRLYKQYQGQNRNNLAQVISEAQAQNRMSSRMGRQPLFNAERGSENIFRSLMQQYQNEGVQTDQQVRGALQGASESTMSGLDGYESITPTRNMATAQNLKGYRDIYGLLRGLGSQQSMYQGSGIYPNQQSFDQNHQPLRPYAYSY